MVGVESVGLTHVMFPAGDRLGEFLAFMSLVPIFLVVSLGTACFVRRDLTNFAFFFGIVANEFLSYMLKHYFRHERPVGLNGRLGHGFAMPSSHTQCIFFFLVCGALHLYKRIDLHHPPFWKHLITAGMFVTSILVAWSRIYLKYHTPNQVLVGGTIGAVCGALWAVLMHTWFERVLYPWLESLPICEYFLIKDSTHIPNVLQFEYNAHKEERKRRGKHHGHGHSHSHGHKQSQPQQHSNHVDKKYS